jgi:hypothetical protein
MAEHEDIARGHDHIKIGSLFQLAPVADRIDNELMRARNAAGWI